MSNKSDEKDNDAKCVHSVEVKVTIKRNEGYNSPTVVESSHMVGTLDLATARTQARKIAREVIARVEESGTQVVKAHDVEVPAEEPAF